MQPDHPGKRPLRLVDEKSATESGSDGEETTGPEKIQQPHGGALLSSGKPGHRGGGGRPKSDLTGLALAKSIGRRHLPGMLRELNRRFYGEPAKPAKGDQPAQPAKKATVYDQTRIAETVARIVALGEKDLSHEGKKAANVRVTAVKPGENPQQDHQQAGPIEQQSTAPHAPTPAPLS